MMMMKWRLWCLVTMAIVLSTTPVHPQSTTMKLPTATNASDFTVTDSTNAVLMKIFGDGGFSLFGNTVSGAIPTSGGGTRLMWYPLKRAFRAGFANSNEWDDSNIGTYSTAIGNHPTASGNASTALGSSTVASGNASFAAGGYATASGLVSTALGYITSAGGDYSTAMGSSTVASGQYAVAAGYQDTASGLGGTAMGYQTVASGGASTALGYQTNASVYSSALGYNSTASEFSTALGSYVTASGSNSIAIGTHASTNGFIGSCIISDFSSFANVQSSAEDEMTMRFDGGYRLFSKWDLTTGVTLASGGSSWSSVSDSTKKTNFLGADGEYFLWGLSRLKLGSWNYKSQDPKHFRHYGPMAQEIFHYFGKDACGTIGNDTTLASADMDGIIMICLQALERRTIELQDASQRMTQLEHLVSEQQLKLSAQQVALDELRRNVQGMISSGKIKAAQANETEGERQ